MPCTGIAWYMPWIPRYLRYRLQENAVDLDTLACDCYRYYIVGVPIAQRPPLQCPRLRVGR